MKSLLLRNHLLIAVLLPMMAAAAAAQNSTPAQVCAACIRHNLDYLAGPELHGRGSGTEDEHRAAHYIAEQLKSYGLTPAAENGEYIQTATISSRKVTGAPTLSYEQQGKAITLTQGRGFALVTTPAQPDVPAPLQKLDLNLASASPTSVKAGLRCS